jgi:zinc transport system substrate-binding protein
MRNKQNRGHRLWTRLVLALLVLALPAASLGETVVTSFYPIYLIALNLCDGIEGVEVHNLAAPETGCLHDYQLSAGDMRALSGADVFLINGAEMESYLAHVFEALPELRVVDASQGVRLLPSDSGETEYNPHIWLDVSNAVVMVRNLAAGLAEAMPAHAEAIAANCEALTARLTALDAELREGLSGLERRTIVTFHEAFPYFASAYGLEVAAVVTQEPGDALSPRELAELISTVRELDNPPLFVEPQYTDLAARTVAEETGAPVFVLDPCVTGPAEEIPLDYYEQVMRRNLETLRTALGAEEESHE